MSEDVKGDVNERPVGHAPGHARHDRLLIVRYAADDLEGTDLEQARTQANQCTDCARLAADTKILQTSLAAMPAAKRTRDFRLSPEQAEQLRGSAFDRLLRRLAMPSFGLLRPVAGVGIALGLVIAAVGGGMPTAYVATNEGAAAPSAVVPAAATAAPGRDTAVPADAGAPVSAEASSGVVGGYSSATSTAAVAPDRTSKAGASHDTLSVSAAPTQTQALAIMPSAAATATQQSGTVAPAAADTHTDNGRLLIVYAGMTVAIVAFGLLLLSFYARRRNEDPLLR